MKTFKKVVYGLCVIYLMVIWGLYFGVVLYEGLGEVPSTSISGGWLFITGLTTMVVLIIYPVKQAVNTWLKWIKEDIKDRKKQKQNNVNKKANTNK